MRRTYGRAMKWTVELPADAESVPLAREAVRERLEGRVDDSLLDDIQIVVSELVTNSVRHGPGTPITLKLFAESPTRISGEVVDHGNGTVAIREAGPDGNGRAGGLGLRLVDWLATDWGVYDASTHVWFAFER